MKFIWGFLLRNDAVIGKWRLSVLKTNVFHLVSNLSHVCKWVCKCLCLLEGKVNLDINSRKVFRIFACILLFLKKNGIFKISFHSEFLVSSFYIYFVNNDLVFANGTYTLKKFRN